MNRKSAHIGLAAAILKAFFACVAIALCLPGTATAAATRPPGDASVQYPDSLTEREKMVKTLIETVHTILSNDKQELPEPPARESNSQPIIKNQTVHHTYRQNSGTSAGNGNPRPYLGPDIPSAELDSEDSSPGTTAKPAKPIPSFPFLSPADQTGQNDTQGNYVWVPDSLYEQVKALLEGHSHSISSVKSSPAANPEEELVVFRNDTLPMVIRDRKFGRFNRKLFNYLAYPRGMWGASLTASYGEISTKDLDMLSLLSDVSIKGHLFSIKPAIYYFVRSNLAIGVRLSYTEGNAGIESFNVDIDDDMNFSLSDINYHTESYQAGLTLTNYYGLSRRSRIHLTNEVELGFASGNSDFRRPYNGQPKETHTTTMKASLTYSPGVSVQIMKNVSFDLSFGAFGLYIKSERQTVDGVKEGSRTSSGANFRFNIFNINFGIGVHL